MYKIWRITTQWIELYCDIYGYTFIIFYSSVLPLEETLFDFFKESFLAFIYFTTYLLSLTSMLF